MGHRRLAVLIPGPVPGLHTETRQNPSLASDVPRARRAERGPCP